MYHIIITISRGRPSQRCIKILHTRSCARAHTLAHTHKKRVKCLSCGGRSLCLLPRPDATISKSNQCPTGSVYSLLLLLLRGDLRCVRVRVRARVSRRGGGGGVGCTSGVLLGHTPLLIDLSFYYHPGECHKVKDTRARRALKRGVSMCACSFTRKTHRRHSLHLHPFTCILLSEWEREFP